MANELPIELLDTVAVLARELPADLIASLASQLRRLEGVNQSRRLSLPTAPGRALLSRLQKDWGATPSVAPTELALALLMAGHTARVVSDAQVVELIRTGPDSPSVPIRRIDEALLELIESAEKTLLIVSYAVFEIPRIVDAMNNAASRGVDIKVVLEFEGAEGEQSFDPRVPLRELDSRCKIYHWPWEERPTVGETGRKGYIHVKCAVADCKAALLSSANLTRYALEANMELGVIVRGGIVADRICEHFDWLIGDHTVVILEEGLRTQ